MERRKRCKHCHRVIINLNRRIKNQEYCNRAACQRARKREWQKRKLASDADYRKNQEEAQREWMEANPDYWQRYRQRNKGYRDRNRVLQKKRDTKRGNPRLAKMDAKMDANVGKNKLILGGYYHITPAFSDLAKMDALAQKYIVIPACCEHCMKSCKEGLNLQPVRDRLRCQRKETIDDDKPTLPREGP